MSAPFSPCVSMFWCGLAAFRRRTGQSGLGSPSLWPCPYKQECSLRCVRASYETVANDSGMPDVRVEEGWMGARRYSHETTLPFLFLAAASYCDPASVQDWRCKPCQQASASLGDLSMITGFSGSTSRLQGFAGYAAKNRLIVVSIRGSAEWRNFWIDAEDYRTASYARCAEDGCLLHYGFLEAFIEVNETLASAARALKVHDPHADLVVLGHSLGGAVASLAAMELHEAHGLSPSAVYTFGQPRVGNQAFASFYDERSAWPTFRVTHMHDLVPHLPPRNVFIPWILTYSHVSGTLPRAAPRLAAARALRVSCRPSTAGTP